jgi:hypothetical protein
MNNQLGIEMNDVIENEENHIIEEVPEQSEEQVIAEDLYYSRLQRMVEEQYQLIENMINTPVTRDDGDDGECADICMCICYVAVFMFVLYFISYVR